jgi:hypothetical protein
MTITSKYFHYAMVAITVAAAGLCLGGIVMGNQLLTKSASRLNELKLESEVLDRQKQDIVLANANIKRYEDLEKIAQQIVPQDKDQTKAVREIIALAQESNVSIGAITFPASNLGQKSAAGSKDKSKDSSATVPDLTQVKPVNGMKGVYELEINIRGSESGTDFQNFVDFLKRLESNQRTSQVSKLDVNPDTEDPNILTFNMTIKVYLKP